METTEKRLGITLEDIERVQRATGEHLNSPMEYYEKVFERMKREQPELLRFLKHAINTLGKVPMILPMGALLTYDALPEELVGEPLTAEQIDAVFQTIGERVVHEGDRNFVFMDWFDEKLEDDSPSYYKWFVDASEVFESDIERNDFRWGSLLVALTFYSRNDARILAQKLGA